jgi:ubiquitin C-terminal hydrolase
VSSKSKLFNKDGQKEMKEFLLRIKNNLAESEDEGRESSRPKFAESDNKLSKNHIVIEFDEDLVV